MDQSLERALAPVLRDLASTGAPEPRVENTHWTDDPEVPSAMLHSPDGGGTGVAVELALSPAERSARVADTVQEWAIEELWREGPTSWPPCPQHPTTHPMAATVRHETAVWACPITGLAVAEIGAL